MSQTKSKHHLKQTARAENHTTHSVVIHIHSELNQDTPRLGLSLCLGGRSIPSTFERQTKKRKKIKKGWEEGIEGEAMRRIGHGILPQGPATGHCDGAEFHHLQEKTPWGLTQWERENVRAGVQKENALNKAGWCISADFTVWIDLTPPLPPKNKVISA